MDFVEIPVDREAFVKLANYPLIKHTARGTAYHTSLPRFHQLSLGPIVVELCTLLPLKVSLRKFQFKPSTQAIVELRTR